MPANVATANLKPPMWSGLGAGRLIRDLGVGSEPAGFLRCGEREGETEEEARGAVRELNRGGEGGGKGEKGEEWWSKEGNVLNKMNTA